MKILVVSDSHGFEGNLRKVIERVEPIDMLIHLGDFESGEDRIKKMVNCEVHMVPGNNYRWYVSVSRIFPLPDIHFLRKQLLSVS